MEPQTFIFSLSVFQRVKLCSKTKGQLFVGLPLHPLFWAEGSRLFRVVFDVAVLNLRIKVGGNSLAGM